MTRSTSPAAIAVAADYADAMITARRAKNWLFFLLLLMLLVQLATFFIAKYKPDLVIRTGHEGEVAAASSRVDVDIEPQPTTSESQPSTMMSTSSTSRTTDAGEVLRYVVGLIGFLGIVFSIVLAFVLLLLVMIMLVGRLIGVSHVTSAFIWSLILMLLLFPWQAFLDPFLFKLPGVLYTWEELRNARFDSAFTLQTLLKWARFVGFPIAAMMILMLVQARSSRGLKYALGESDVHIDVTTSAT